MSISKIDIVSGDSIEINVQDQTFRGFISPHVIVTATLGEEKSQVAGYFLTNKTSCLIYFRDIDVINISRIVLTEKTKSQFELTQDVRNKAFESHSSFRAYQFAKKARQTGINGMWASSAILHLSKQKKVIIAKD
jgi:hypothetical protein